MSIREDIEERLNKIIYDEETKNFFNSEECQRFFESGAVIIVGDEKKQSTSIEYYKDPDQCFKEFNDLWQAYDADFEFDDSVEMRFPTSTCDDDSWDPGYVYELYFDGELTVTFLMINPEYY